MRRAGPILVIAPLLLSACEMVPDISAWTGGDDEAAIEADAASPAQSPGQAMAAAPDIESAPAGTAVTTREISADPDLAAPPPPIDPTEYLTLATLDTRRDAMPAPDDDGSLGLELGEVAKARAWVDGLAGKSQKRTARSVQTSTAAPTPPPTKPAAVEVTRAAAATTSGAETGETTAADATTEAAPDGSPTQLTGTSETGTSEAESDTDAPAAGEAEIEASVAEAADTAAATTSPATDANTAGTEADAPAPDAASADADTAAVADAKEGTPDFDSVFESIGVTPAAPEQAESGESAPTPLSAEAQAAGEKAAAPTNLVPPPPKLDETAGEPEPSTQLAVVTTDAQSKADAIAEMASETPDTGDTGAAPAAPTAEQVASLTTKMEPEVEDTLEPAKEIGNLRILFAEESSDLTPRAEADLAAFAQQVMGKQGAGVRILAYAKGTEETAIRARRTSLSRSLAVRSFLIEKGIPKVKVDLAALGNKYKDGPPDRVDLVVVER